jgi:hypothetical protein
MKAVREREHAQDGQQYSRDDDKLDYGAPENRHTSGNQKQHHPRGFRILRGNLTDEHPFAPHGCENIGLLPLVISGNLEDQVSGRGVGRIGDGA